MGNHQSEPIVSRVLMTKHFMIEGSGGFLLLELLVTYLRSGLTVTVHEGLCETIRDHMDSRSPAN